MLQMIGKVDKNYSSLVSNLELTKSLWESLARAVGRLGDLDVGFVHCSVRKAHNEFPDNNTFVLANNKLGWSSKRKGNRRMTVDEGGGGENYASSPWWCLGKGSVGNVILMTHFKPVTYDPTVPRKWHCDGSSGRLASTRQRSFQGAPTYLNSLLHNTIRLPHHVYQLASSRCLLWTLWGRQGNSHQSAHEALSK